MPFVSSSSVPFAEGSTGSVWKSQDDWAKVLLSLDGLLRLGLIFDEIDEQYWTYGNYVLQSNVYLILQEILIFDMVDGLLDGNLASLNQHDLTCPENSMVVEEGNRFLALPWWTEEGVSVWEPAHFVSDTGFARCTVRVGWRLYVTNVFWTETLCGFTNWSWYWFLIQFWWLEMQLVQIVERMAADFFKLSMEVSCPICNLVNQTLEMESFGLSFCVRNVYPNGFRSLQHVIDSIVHFFLCSWG